jgi:hypothetical protein
MESPVSIQSVPPETCKNSSFERTGNLLSTVEEIVITNTYSSLISSHQILSFLLMVYITNLSLFLLSSAFKLKEIKTFNLVSYIIEVSLSNLTLLGLSPVLIAGFTLVLIIRLILNTCLFISSRGKVRLLRSTDAFWACDKEIQTNYILLFASVEGHHQQTMTMTLHSFCRKILRILDVDSLLGSNGFQNLKCKITTRLGFFCWEDSQDTFDIKNHVTYLDENDPFRPFTKSQIFNQLEKLYDYPMPDNHPKWRFYFIPNYLIKEDSDIQSSEHTAFVWRIHHAFLDGVSANSFFNWMLFDYPMEMAVNCFKSWDSSWIQNILLNLNLFIFGPHVLFKSIFTREKHCFHGPELQGSKTLGSSRTLNLSALKEMKNSSKTSITTLQIAALGGGLRRLALKKGYEVPMVIQSSVTAAMFPYEGLKNDNRFTIARMPIEIAHDSISVRLESASKSAKELSRSIEFLVTYKLVKLIGLLPAAVIEWFINDQDATLLLSNVPGLKEKVTIHGMEVQEIMGFNVIKGTVGEENKLL